MDTKPGGPRTRHPVAQAWEGFWLEFDGNVAPASSRCADWRAGTVCGRDWRIRRRGRAAADGTGGESFVRDRPYREGAKAQRPGLLRCADRAGESHAVSESRDALPAQRGERTEEARGLPD